MANKLIFKNAEAIKDSIMDSQKKEIAKLYENWADEIGEKAKFYSHKSTASAPVSERYYKELKKQLRETSQQVSNEIYGKIKNNMYIISDAVVADNVEWLKSFGFSEKGLNAAFSYVPDDVVKNLITGQVYDSGWSLSKRIWGDNEQTLKDIYGVMAKGVAMNKPLYEIAKDLESYVRPDARLPWNLTAKDGVRIFKKQVDYNAQRLARTLTQHSYQQSFVATTINNPFITEYIWHSNGSRVCELCLARDGVHYKKNELPLDHPNGMCVMEPAVAEDMADQLAEWFNSPDGTFPEIDAFASNFGYEVSKKGTVQDFINKYGTSDKNVKAWKQSLTPAQKAEAKLLKEQSGLTWDQWYENNIYSGSADDLAAYKAKKAAKKASKKAANKADSALDDALAVAQKKLDEIPNKVYSGIWKEDVTLADYEYKKGKIQAKKEYFEDMMKTSKLVGKQDLYDKMAKLLDDLEEFEELGKKYAAAQKEVKSAKFALQKAKGSTTKFDASDYTDEAKALAHKFTSPTAADKFYRPYLDEVWEEATEYERYSVWEYTKNSHPINKSLSGYHDSWTRDSFLGLGNTDLGHENPWRTFNTSAFSSKFGVNGHKDYKSVVQNLTNVIEKSEIPESVFLVRGSDKNGLAGLLEGDLFSFDDATKLINSGDINAIRTALEGQTFTNHSFTSTGIAQGTGFSHERVQYEIFAPKGTHAIYAEPASYYGDTVGMTEKLYKTGQSYSSVGGEAEIVIQRGTDFRITGIESDGYGGLTVKMEVVNQPDYFQTGLEHTHNLGKTSYTK